MQIEIAEPGRMTQSGSSLLKLIQNNDMPILDLLARESIQNSLDARKASSRYVEVEFVTGSFNSNRLGDELEGITRALKNNYPHSQYRFIAVRDSNTEGLTGEMDYKKVKDNDYGNLLKLIYEICKPQEAEGAGGSWGIGKTIYFRIGIGMVIYYSRIKTSGGFESRLAASYVEDETSANAMIPVYKEQAKRGIAWWGDLVGENVTQPVTDERYIEEFLSIFGIERYHGEDTGTTIIIPYIDDEKLLANNRVEYLDGRGQPVIPYWGHDVESYFKIAAQRWYAPRLNNVHYTHGAFLRLRINGEGLSLNKMEPSFKVIQALYNRANHIEEEDILSDTDAVVKVDGIKVLKYLKDTNAGIVAFAKVPRELLGMAPPLNKPEPYMYFNSEIHDEDSNKPIICFTRKPAMIVSYENVGVWASRIAATSKKEYIFAIFALNSWNTMKNNPVNPNSSLEEYVRKSERADHTSWKDWSEGTYNPRIITKIQNGVNKLVSREFAPEEEAMKPKANTGLGKMFGDMLLPPDGFGKRPGPGPGTNPESRISKKRGLTFRIDEPKTKYLEHSMIIQVVLETSAKKKISNAALEIQIDTEAKRISIDEWENKLSLKTPMSIRDCKIDISALEGKRMNQSIGLSSGKRKYEAGDLQFKLLYTNNGTCYGIRITSDEGKSIKARMFINLDINRRDIKPAFIFEKEGANGK